MVPLMIFTKIEAVDDATMQPRRNQKPSTWTNTTATTTVNETKTTTTHSRDFWAVRAEVLHQLFPDVEPLELILFTASSTNVVLMGAGEGQRQRV